MPRVCKDCFCVKCLRMILIKIDYVPNNCYVKCQTKLSGLKNVSIAILPVLHNQLYYQ